MNGQSIVQQQCLLQEGVSSALATLAAIQGAGLLDSVPSDPDDAARHNHGLALLHMLDDHLRSFQKQVDAIAAEAAARRSEGN